MPDECVNNQCCSDRREACEKLINVRLDVIRELFESKVAATEKATELAAQVLKERLKNLNELRQMAQDRDANYITKAEFNLQVKEIESLRLSRASLEGKASQAAVNVTFIVSAIGMLLAIISIIIGLFHV